MRGRPAPRESRENSTSWHEPSFFFNDTATTEIYTLSLHDALPIWRDSAYSSTASGTGARTGRWTGACAMGACQIRSGNDPRALAEFGEILGRAFEGKPVIDGLQFRHGVHLAGDLENQVGSPLHRLGGVRKRHAITADPIHIHGGARPPASRANDIWLSGTA